MNQILVKKRNGQEQKIDISKIKRNIIFACEKHLDKCDPNELEMDAQLNFVNGIKTEDIQKILIQTAVEKTISKTTDEFGNEVPVINTSWSFVASNLYAYDLYKRSALVRGHTAFGYGDFLTLLKIGIENNIYKKELLEFYTEDEIKELGSYIKMERDELLSYYGIQLLASRYLAKITQDKENKVFELPQERFMIVAMSLASNEKPNERISYAKKFYDLLSQLKMTVATPTLANAGTTLNQLSSCFVNTIDDSLDSIYKGNDDFAQVSKHGGAMGTYLGKIRALGSDIRGFQNASGGVVPWVKLYNNTAISVDQLGRRKGSITITLDIWHKDIYSFLDIKTNNGDDRLKAHDVFPAISIPHLFMERLEQRSDWSLFDPHQVKKIMGYSLEDYYDDTKKSDKEFTKRYLECEQNPNIDRITVPALDVMKKIMKSAAETGTPFIFFRDTANTYNPNKHKGMIYSSNLCQEISQNTSVSKFVSSTIDEEGNVVTKFKRGDIVTCNLSSINLGALESIDELKEIIPLQIRMLDNVIDINNLPLAEAKATTKEYRSIGLGVSGYHQFLVNNNIKWESEEHLEIADKLFNELSYQVLKASNELAKEKGAYPLFKGSLWETGEWFEYANLYDQRWRDLSKSIKENGIRNGYLIAIAPTGSTSHISDSTAGIDPVFAKYWSEEKKGVHLPKTAPNLNDDNYWLYKEAHNIDQQWSIKACQIRQRYIDQAQSFNLYITPETSAKEILEMYMECWRRNIKTIYYIRNKSLEVNECTSCSS